MDVARTLERISIELTNCCAKACAFCYNASDADGRTEWTVPEVVGFVRDCATHGVRAVSFGGGEPLQYEGLFPVLEQLAGTLFRSVTTNGLPLLKPDVLDALVRARPDKVHVSLHFADRDEEVARVIAQVGELAARGIKSGVNFLVPRSRLPEAEAAAQRVRDAGIGPERVVYLPMRKADTPTPEQVARVAGGARFQSMPCLTGCRASPRFASIGWDRTVAWCSYTRTRMKLPELTHAGLVRVLGAPLGLTFCGGIDEPVVPARD